MGEITSLKATFTRDKEGRIRQYLLGGTCGEGAVFSIANSTLSALNNSACIYGTEGSLVLKNYWKADTLEIRGKKEELLSYPCAHELVYEILHFVQCVRQGLSESPVMTEALSVAGIAALERALLS